LTAGERTKGSGPNGSMHYQNSISSWFPPESNFDLLLSFPITWTGPLYTRRYNSSWLPLWELQTVAKIQKVQFSEQALSLTAFWWDSLLTQYVKRCYYRGAVGKAASVERTSWGRCITWNIAGISAQDIVHYIHSTDSTDNIASISRQMLKCAFKLIAEYRHLCTSSWM
jgi:hypothetical protein